MRLKTGAGDVFGGLASMLVAFPSAVAFGLVVFAPLGSSLGAEGVLAGMIGAVALGIIAPLFGGAPRLITAPCAPAAAVLAGFVAERATRSPESAVALVCIVIVLAGCFQLLFGLLGGGKIIKYIPYPVVAGYLSGVGLLIIVTQIPKFLGLPKDVSFFAGISSPELWNMIGVIVGGITILTMVSASWITRAVPASILALAAGCGAYFLLSMFYPDLMILKGNALLIGDMPSIGLIQIFRAFSSRLLSFGSLDVDTLLLTLIPALTLAVLLAIDTLKTCVVLDALTHSRHNSNRELVAQGLGNVAAGMVGGLSGAGTMGATLVNISSGGHSKLSGIFEGVFCAAALLILGRLVAWIPVSVLAAILIVVAFRMIDRKSFLLLRQRATVVDFAVIAAVVVAALATSLIVAAGVGLALAVALFIRNQMRASVVRRLTFGNQVRSKKMRLPGELGILEAQGLQAAIFELQGSLFFGTTDQLFSLVEPHLSEYKYVILDMRRVQSVDFTAAHMLEYLDARISEKSGHLIFSDIPRTLPTGQNLKLYFDQVGLVHPKRSIRIFPELDAALEWVEDRILDLERKVHPTLDKPLELEMIEIFRELPSQALAVIARCVVERTFDAGEHIFKKGDGGDELFVIRQGEVRIELPLSSREAHHLATFGKGDFFGDMSFLDQGKRSADAVAKIHTMLFVLSRKIFDDIASKEPEIAGMVFSRLARVLAIRLRHTNSELQVLEEA